MRLVKGLLERCLDVIELLSCSPHWRRLSDIALALDLQKGPAHRLLTEMVALGWIEQDAETERYRLTLKLALLGQQFLHGTGLSGLVQPVLDEVARRCGELVRLTMAQGDALYWFAYSQGAQPGLMYQPSMSGRPVLYATANGKAWLATMRDEAATGLAVRAGLGQPQMSRGGLGPRALCTAEALLGELALTRARGYGLALEEAEQGIKAIAVAVRLSNHTPAVGTISIAGPLLRMDEERDAAFVALLENAAAALRMVWPRDERALAQVA